jgi:hypothetical protein
VIATQYQKGQKFNNYYEETKFLAEVEELQRRFLQR